MREKKKYRILTFQTTTDAMAMEKKCSANGIPGRVIPVPRELSADCGLAWRMEVSDFLMYKERICELNRAFYESREVML